MVRHYKKKPGARNYKNYSSGTLEECLTAISNGMTITEASTKFKIHRNTISNKLHEKHSKPAVNKQHLKTISLLFFHVVVKIIFSRSIAHFDRVWRATFGQLLCSYGCMGGASWSDGTQTDHQTLSWSNEQTSSGFRDNFPGPDWAKLFLLRQTDQLKECLADNIRKSRANISRAIVNNFFDNVSDEIPSVPDSNIFNFDETNLSDDPGRKKVIAKHTCKRTERVINYSKSCISIMFCGSASGDILPPYTVYKADHLYDSWKFGGPKKSRYNRSPSGWFDSTTFEDWFETLFLPHVRRLPGKKVLIGDNVAGHLSIRVIKMCQENDIKRIFMPRKINQQIFFPSCYLKTR